MENLSVSKIHKLTKTEKPLNQFINDEKTFFDAKKEMVEVQRLFEGWILKHF